MEPTCSLEDSLRRAEPVGQGDDDLGPSTGAPSGIGSQRTSISSSDALPQIPQLAVATK